MDETNKTSERAQTLEFPLAPPPAPAEEPAPAEKPPSPGVEQMARWVDAHPGQFLGLLGTLATIVLAFTAFEQHRNEVQRFALLEVVKGWNESTNDLKGVIESGFPGLYNAEAFHLLDPQTAQELYEASLSDREHYEVRQAIVRLLNYFEFIAVATEQGVADEEIVRGFAKGPMTRWWRALRPFIEVYNEERNSCVWRPYYDLMESWGEEPASCGFGPRAGATRASDASVEPFLYPWLSTMSFG